MADEKQQMLTKFILYADKEMCREMAEFYHDTLGLDYISHIDNYYWVEFDTGPCKLCLHHNHQDQGLPAGLVSRNAVVINLENADIVRKLYAKLIEQGYVCTGGNMLAKIGDLSNLIEAERQSLCLFRIVDPVGNIAQFEAPL